MTHATHRISNSVRAFLPVTDVKGLKEGIVATRYSVLKLMPPLVVGRFGPVNIVPAPYAVLRVISSRWSLANFR